MPTNLPTPTDASATPGDSVFVRDLKRLINKYNQEANSNTPDFILADYLSDCLLAWNKATARRDLWYES